MRSMLFLTSEVTYVPNTKPCSKLEEWPFRAGTDWVSDTAKWKPCWDVHLEVTPGSRTSQIVLKCSMLSGHRTKCVQECLWADTQLPLVFRWSSSLFSITTATAALLWFNSQPVIEAISCRYSWMQSPCSGSQNCLLEGAWSILPLACMSGAWQCGEAEKWISGGTFKIGCTTK